MLARVILALAAAAWAQGRTAPPLLSVVERVFTLEEAQRLARLNDPLLLSAEQDTIISEQRVTEARFQFLPELGLQASATKFESRYPFALPSEFHNILVFPSPANRQSIYSGRSYARMSLYEGRRHINTLELARAAHKQALSHYESVKRDVLLSTQEAFYRLLLAQERLAEVEHSQAAINAIGLDHLGAWQRVQAQALIESVREETEAARHELDTTKLSFLENLNLELDTPFRVSGALKAEKMDVDLDKAGLWALELRPELQSETYKAQMDAISVSLALSRRNPTIFLAGDYELVGQAFPLRQNNWAGTIGIKLPFSYDYWSQVKQRKAEQRQGELKRAQLQDQVRLEVRQAYEKYHYWQKEWPQRQAQYMKIKGLYDAAAASKVAPGLDQANAASALAGLKLSYLSALTEHILARAKLEWAVGRELSR